MIDDAVAARIVDLAAVRAHEAVLEIGGGHGELTRHLAGRGARTVCVEIDPRLAAVLAERYATVEVRSESIVDLSCAALGPGPWVVVGNLPYYLTSEILLWLCRQRGVVDRAIVMVQKEVAERLAARPGARSYGRLTVAVAYHAEVEVLFGVEPTSFRPPPQIDSAVVRLRLREQPPVVVADEQRLFALVEHGFRWRRKTLANVLARWLGGRDTAEAALCAAGIDGGRRAETLSLEEFAALAERLP